MLFLPTPCPDYNGLTMQVVEHEPDDSYQARCVVCGFRSLGKIAPELLIAKGASDSTPQKTTRGESPDFHHVSPPGRKMGCRA
jgi:hypothetical protein